MITEPYFFTKKTNFIELMLKKSSLPKPRVLYRYFSEENHANDFVQGKFRISTLSICRGYEDPAKGDPGEASSTFHIAKAHSATYDADFVNLLGKAGIKISGEYENIMVENINNTSFLKDAYVLCLSLENTPSVFNDSFGKYCVRINHPESFFRILSKQLVTQLGIHHCIANHINYTSRVFSGSDTLPHLVEMAFVKPVIPYFLQQGFRMLWLTKNDNDMTFFDVDCPGIKGTCERII